VADRRADDREQRLLGEISFFAMHILTRRRTSINTSLRDHGASARISLSRRVGGGMLTWDQIELLVRFDGGRARVLSVYLDLQPANQQAFRVRFDDLVKQTSERLPRPDRRQLTSEVDRVQKWFDGITRPHGLGLIVARERRVRFVDHRDDFKAPALTLLPQEGRKTCAETAL
jgi:hypothetical protein